VIKESKKSDLILLFGGLAKDSLLTEQLGIESIFDLFIRDGWYLENPQKWFPDFDAKTSFKYISGTLSENRISEHLHYFSQYERIVLWPACKMLTDPRAGSGWLRNLLPHFHGSIVLGEALAFVLTKNEWTKLDFQNQVLGPACIELGRASHHLNVLGLCTPARSFNSIHFHDQRILKTCHNRQKGQDEISFLQMIPGELQKYYPPLLSFLSDEPDGPDRPISYQIPQYRMFDLSRHLIHGSLEVGGSQTKHWETVFKKLDLYFHSLPRREVGALAIRASLENLLINKLTNRMRDLKQIAPQINCDQIYLELVENLNDEIQKSDRTEVFFCHGDLCFSNILYNRKTEELKLIDPRGAATLDLAFIPIEYDFAKLSQCIFGGYDLIMAQDLQIQGWSEQSLILQRYFRKLMGSHQVSEKLIRLAEASLFLSMMPLHLDQAHLFPLFIGAAKKAMHESKGMSRAS
jgi:thiamine kinase-like enzyme